MGDHGGAVVDQRMVGFGSRIGVGGLGAVHGKNADVRLVAPQRKREQRRQRRAVQPPGEAAHPRQPRGQRLFFLWRVGITPGPWSAILKVARRGEHAPPEIDFGKKPGHVKPGLPDVRRNVRLPRRQVRRAGIGEQGDEAGGDFVAQGCQPLLDRPVKNGVVNDALDDGRQPLANGRFRERAAVGAAQRRRQGQAGFFHDQRYTQGSSAATALTSRRSVVQKSAFSCWATAR